MCALVVGGRRGVNGGKEGGRREEREKKKWEAKLERGRDKVKRDRDIASGGGGGDCCKIGGESHVLGRICMNVLESECSFWLPERGRGRDMR